MHIYQNGELQRATVDVLEALPLERMIVVRRSPCLLYTSPSPRDRQKSRMPSSA